MATFPKIQGPCPYKDNIAAYMKGGTCGLCQRQVHDLTAMSDAERTTFLAGCSGEVCVSYRFPLRAAAAAVLSIAAFAAPMAAAAQQFDDTEIIVGAITDPSNVEYISDDKTDAPEIPVVYEETQSATAESTPATDDASAPRPDLAHPVQTQ
jgi:hypothetical protein